MAKKKEESKITKNEQQLLDGIGIIDQHPLFGRLYIAYARFRNRSSKSLCYVGESRAFGVKIYRKRHYRNERQPDIQSCGKNGFIRRDFFNVRF